MTSAARPSLSGTGRALKGQERASVVAPPPAVVSGLLLGAGNLVCEGDCSGLVADFDERRP